MQPAQEEIINALLRRHGRTYAEEIGINLRARSPEGLFRLLCSVLLFSTRISAKVAVQAARLLGSRGWTTPQRLARSTWEERVRALDEARYVRYDERTARELGAMAETVRDRYDGDLNGLRERARREPGTERELLKEFKGIGDVGVDIFFREAQVVWDELFPFADRKAREGARLLGLKSDPRVYATYLRHDDYVRFAAALVRVRLEGDARRIREEALRSEGVPAGAGA